MFQKLCFGLSTFFSVDTVHVYLQLLDVEVWLVNNIAPNIVLSSGKPVLKN